MYCKHEKRQEKSAQMTITPDCRCLIGTSWRVGIALLLERQRAPLTILGPRSLRHPVTSFATVLILLSFKMNMSLGHTDVNITVATGAPLTACTKRNHQWEERLQFGAKVGFAFNRRRKIFIQLVANTLAASIQNLQARTILQLA